MHRVGDAMSKKVYVFITLSLVLCLGMKTVILNQEKVIDTLEKQDNQMQEECAELEKQIAESMEANAALRDEINVYLEEKENVSICLQEWKDVYANEWQAFHDEWYVKTFYVSDTWDKQDKKKYISRIIFNRKYIWMTDDHITDAPIYDVNLCKRDEILQELSDIGINYEEIEKLLDHDYYLEMDFSNTLEWNRHVFPAEEDFVYEAKYYPINRDIMLCISKNGNGIVYVLKRFLFWQF